ncbi:DUF202 domain-containing protein [Sphingomonas sp. R-74633]|uniref:YidH family protein n=1 Tax=Sphingomonas sp. R-74633 TaxID=2751188 RepID=UPI0015D2A454|nr:DUF202 domain-containing protein [Sphingomonas sp. R-74633]NYT42252.1 DUF202 domain-containing protein [Sphingomonas sp. R-74633]
MSDLPGPKRPDRFNPAPVPDIPDTSQLSGEEIPTTYSHFRTGLSRHRTGLSEHRTDLSEYRTDLSTHRTDLSTERTELSMRRSGMSVQRTRMSADRTLMSVIRTSLSLIGFGFTLAQFFSKLRDAGTITHAAAPRNFGLMLILLGVLLLIGGIVRHLQFAIELRNLRGSMVREGLLHGEMKYPISLTLITAILLLAIGVAAAVNIVWGLGIFG